MSIANGNDSNGRKGGKMRKSCILFLMFIISINILINAEPYKPKPILLIHGIDGNSKCWGVSPKYVDTTYNNKIYNIAKDSIIKDSIIDGRILPVCLEKLIPMVWNWYNSGDSTYTPDPYNISIPEENRKRYPNKALLEIVNFHDNNGSIDIPGNYWPIADKYDSPTYCCQAEELANRIRSVLGEYYGTGPADTSRTATWVNDTTANSIAIEGKPIANGND